MGLSTIFDQDGKLYAAMSHAMPAKDLAKEIAHEIRMMPMVPRSQMRIVTDEEVRAMPWGSPQCLCKKHKSKQSRGL
jgi:hypothetical protein